MRLRVNFFRIIFFVSILSAFLLFFLTRNVKCFNCNVILISIDTLRADHLSAYGYKLNTSPKLDKFAKESMLFKHFFSTAPWTLPSHASMLASDTPTGLKMETIFDKMPNNVPTLAKVLHNRGYFTYGIDSYTYVSPKWGFEQGFDEYVVDSQFKNGNDAKAIFSRAQNWLAQNRSKKFFLFLHSFDIHDPFCPPPPYADKYKGSNLSKLSCITSDMIFNNVNDKGEQLTGEDLRRIETLYDGEISYTDSYLGKFLDFVKRLNLDKNTIIILTSDHGEEFGEHGAWGKHADTLYNELIRVPLIIKTPFLKPTINNSTFSTIDLAPSILEFLGLPKQKGYKGVSILDSKKKRPVFFELANTQMVFRSGVSKYYDVAVDIDPSVRLIHNIGKQKIGVLFDGWKLIVNFDLKNEELYNINMDYSEKINLINKEKKKAYELRILLKNHFKLENDNLETINKNYNIEPFDAIKSIGY